MALDLSVQFPCSGDCHLPRLKHGCRYEGFQVVFGKLGTSLTVHLQIPSI